MEITKKKYFFCSFADRRMHQSLKRIGQQAKEMDIFDEIYLYNELKLSRKFKNKFSRFLSANTFYLCAWKPQVILQTFNKMKDGDLLLYADAGCHLNSKGIKRLNEYFEITDNSFSGILATVASQDMPEKNWTKGDTFDYFACRNNKKITHSGQIGATTFVIKKDTKTTNFINEWLKVFEDYPALAFRNYFRNSNLDGYVDHRSDQSFFSILGKINNIELVTKNEVEGSAAWETDMIQFPIWAKRDRVIDNRFIKNISWNRIKMAIRRRVLKTE